jgi:hypothetical protein
VPIFDPIAPKTCRICTRREACIAHTSEGSLDEMGAFLGTGRRRSRLRRRCPFALGCNLCINLRGPGFLEPCSLKFLCKSRVSWFIAHLFPEEFLYKNRNQRVASRNFCRLRNFQVLGLYEPDFTNSCTRGRQ